MENTSVYEKLKRVQSELKAPKNQFNKFGNYNYRNCEDIQEAVKPILAEVGAVIKTGDELVQIGERYYIKATAEFIDTADGLKVSNTAYAREPLSKKGMDESQITGATSSYARKYALNGLLCIDDVKDSDTPNPNDKPPVADKTNIELVAERKIYAGKKKQLSLTAKRTEQDIVKWLEKSLKKSEKDFDINDLKKANLALEKEFEKHKGKSNE